MPGQNQIPRQLEPLMRALLGGGPTQVVQGGLDVRGTGTGGRPRPVDPGQIISEMQKMVPPTPYPPTSGPVGAIIRDPVPTPYPPTSGPVGAIIRDPVPTPMPPPGPVGGINRDTGPSPGQYSGMMEALGGMMGGPPMPPPRPRRGMPTRLESPRTDINYGGSLEDILRQYGQPAIPPGMPGIPGMGGPPMPPPEYGVLTDEEIRRDFPARPQPGGPPIPPRPRRRMPTSLESPRTDVNYGGSLDDILRQYGQ